MKYWKPFLSVLIALSFGYVHAQKSGPQVSENAKVVDTTLQDSSKAGNKKNQARTLLVFTLDVTNAKQTVAENLTEKLFLSMTSAQGLRADYIRNQAKIEDNISGKNEELYRQGVDCQDADCAADIADALGYNFSLIGSIKKQGAGYTLDMKVIESKTKSPVFSREEKFRQGKKDIIAALPLWGEVISKKVADPDFAKTILNPELAAKEAENSKEPVKGWKSKDFDPFTAHLKGTRIYGNITDTLKRSGSPYIVTSNLIVPSGTDLVIEKGVTIFVGGEYTTITVMGKILAMGTAKHPIKIKSGKKEVANWDWDRLYFRSKERSLLEHVHIENSNYGVVVKNGALTLSHCVLANNSVRGIYLENSNVEILDSRIHEGHLIGLQVGDYGEATVERSTIKGNHNGISILDYGTLQLRQSRVEENDRGLILMDSVALTLESSHITNNRVGVVTSATMSKGVFDGLKGNQSNIEAVRREKVAALVEKPAAVNVKRKSKQSLKDEPSVAKKEFKGGVKSLKKDKGKLGSLIGNVAIGEGYHYPTTPKNSTLDVIVTSKDSIQPGQRLTQDKVIPGFHHTASVFSTLELLNLSFDGNMDVRYDDWGNAQLEAVSVKSKLGPNSFALGDFNENGSEITMSGLQIRGGKYGLGLFNNRQESPRLRVSGMFGESERPYDEGERVLGSYNERKQEGSATAQKLVGVGRVEINPTPQWGMNVNYIFSDDKRDGILRDKLSSTAVTSDAPLTSNMLGVESEWRLLKEKLVLTAEVNVGTVDSTTQAYNLAVEKVLASDEFGRLSETEITGMLPLLQPTVKDDFLDSNYVLIPISLLDSATLANQDDLSPDEINELRRELLDSIVKVAELEEPEIQDELDESKDFGFRWEDQGMAARLAANFSLGGTVFDVSYIFVGNEYYTGGNRYLTKDMRKYEFSLGRDLTKKINLNVDYLLSIENSSSTGQFKNLLGFGEGSDFGLFADEDFQQKQEDNERDRPKFTHNLKWQNRYNVNSILELTFDAGLGYKAEMRAKELSSDTSIIFADGYFEDPDGVNFVFDNQFQTIDSALAADFTDRISNNDDENLPLARVLDDKEFTYNLGLKSKIRFSKWGNIDIGGKWNWRDDKAKYKYTDIWDEYDLHDSTLINLGFYQGGENEFRQDYTTALTLKSKTLSNKLGFKYGLNNKIKRNEDITSWEIKNNLKWKIIPRKLRMTLTGKIKQKETIEDEQRKYILQDGKKYYRYDTDTQELVGNNASNSTSLTLVTPGTLSGQVFTEEFRSEELQNDFLVELKLRYSFNSKLYAESTARKDWVLRPDQLEQEYEDIFGEVQMYYSF